MVVHKFYDPVRKIEDSIYCDNWLHNSLLNKVLPALNKKDEDRLFLIDGPEGSGKSVFTQSMAKILNPKFSEKDMAMSPSKFTALINTAKKHDTPVFDEAHSGFGSSYSITSVGKALRSKVMEMRQLNLCVFIVLPSFFDLNKYIVLHRANGLFHVRKYKGKRGFWSYYGPKKLRLMWIKGHKTYSYGVKPDRVGRFTSKYVIDETKYREMKRKALQEEDETAHEKRNKLMEERNLILKITRELLEDFYGPLSDTKATSKLKERGYAKSTAQLVNIWGSKDERTQKTNNP